MVKRLPTMRETQVQSLDWEDPLEKEMATHSSTLAWKIPWMEVVGYSLWGHKELVWVTSLSLSLLIHEIELPRWCSGKESACQCRRRRFSPWVRKICRRKWQLPVFLPGKSHWHRSLAGYSQWGPKRVGHDWATNIIPVYQTLSGFWIYNSMKWNNGLPSKH